MIGLLSDFRGIASQEASIPALRACLVLFAIFAAIAWTRRRPLLALLVLSTGGLVGLGYWLIQIVSPLGLGTDPALTLVWAQAGVSALAAPRGSGFVWGTPAQLSLVSTLASVGAPLDFVHVVPQMAAFMTLVVVMLTPFAFSRNRTTAAFAASLALGGGVWPGVAPYGSILLRPSALLVGGGLVGILWMAWQMRPARRALTRFRITAVVVLTAGAALDRALAGGVEPSVAGGLLFAGLTLVLASPVRAMLRVASSSAAGARRAEALTLLCVFLGSGLAWWNPARSIADFGEARSDNVALLRAMDWIRGSVPKSSVVLASPAYSASIAALAGRRVLVPPPTVGDAPRTALPEPFRRLRLVESVRLGHPIERLADAFSVTHLVLGPGEPNPEIGLESPTDEPRMKLVLVYEDVRDFRVFRLAKK